MYTVLPYVYSKKNLGTVKYGQPGRRNAETLTHQSPPLQFVFEKSCKKQFFCYHEKGSCLKIMFSDTSILWVPALVIVLQLSLYQPNQKRGRLHQRDHLSCFIQSKQSESNCIEGQCWKDSWWAQRRPQSHWACAWWESMFHCFMFAHTIKRKILTSTM